MKTEKLPTEQIEWVAKLTHIEVSEAEKDKYAEDLSAVLDYVDELKQVNTDMVKEVQQITGLDNISDADAVEKSEISRDEFLKQAPMSDKGYIRVKNVFSR